MRFENIDDVEACAALVQAAYDAGITYFDTARNYFGGRSEERFGTAFAEMKKTRAERPFHVATKTFASTPDQIRRDAEEQLERLQLDAIDFYHVWCIKTREELEERRRDGVLEGFLKLKEEGLVNHVCISSHQAGSEIAGVLRDYPFEGVLLGYCVMNANYREEGLRAAAELNRGCVVMNPLGGGVIPKEPELFDFVRTREDETVVEGALRFLWNDPRITVALVGFQNETQLREAVAAMEGFRPIPEAETERIRGNLREAFDELCTACGYCDHCPEGIPVPKLMQAYNEGALQGDLRKGVHRLKIHWGVWPPEETLDLCIECGACEEACTQKLPIMKRLRELKEATEAYHVQQEEKRKAREAAAAKKSSS
jgi:hypothetical protein